MGFITGLMAFANDNPAVVFFAIIAFVIWATRLTVRLSAYERRSDERFEAMQKLSDARFQAVEKRLDDIWQSIRSIAQTVPAGGQSPLNLNDYGKKISQTINAPEIAQKYLGKIEFEADANAYEIQEACLNYADNKLFDALNREEKTRLQMYCYESSDKMWVPLQVLGLEMRNIILKSKGIPTTKAEMREAAEKHNTA